MKMYVVINEVGMIFGLYEEFEDAWDRQEQVMLQGFDADIEEYIVNMDVDPIDLDDEDDDYDEAEPA